MTSLTSVTVPRSSASPMPDTSGVTSDDGQRPPEVPGLVKSKGTANTKFDIGSGDLVPDINATQMVVDVSPSRDGSRDSANDCEDVVPDYDVPTKVPFEGNSMNIDGPEESSSFKQQGKRPQQEDLQVIDPQQSPQQAPQKSTLPSQIPQSSPSEEVIEDEFDNGNIPQQTDENRDSGEFIFKKKDVKPRTQSFQSVLSTASLKSLGQPIRNNSIVSTAPNNNSKNFQSFIQAPVLSSVTNRKSDQIEIGRQFPFNNKKTPDTAKSHDNSESKAPATDDDPYDDQDTILQQQRLTLNALKKLSLSPLPKIDSEQKPPSPRVQSKPQLKPSKSNSSMKKSEPYQPAAVDLSTFASLTRQPHSTLRTLNNSTESTNANATLSSKKSTVSLPSPLEQEANSSLPSVSAQSTESNGLSSTQMYHNEVHQNHLNNLNLKVQTQRNSLVNGLNQRRRSQNTSPMSTINRVPSPSQSSNQSQWNQFQGPMTGLGNGQGFNRQKSTTSIPNRGSVSVPVKEQNGKEQNSQDHQSIQNPEQVKDPQNPNPQNPTTQPSTTQIPPQENQSYFKLQQLQSQSKSQTQSLKQKHLQQIKGLRSPMYIPAVLRLTQDGEDRDSAPTQNASSAASMRSFDSNVSTDSTNSPRLSPSASAKTFKSYEQFLRQAPTRKHWLKDETVYKCGISGCYREFNFFERRHHCRKCGGIFCKEHTSHFLYINHLAQFTTGGRGTLSRVCDNCIQEYNEFMRTQFGLGSSDALQAGTQVSAQTGTQTGTQVTAPIDPKNTNNTQSTNNTNDTTIPKDPKNYPDFDLKSLTKQKSFKHFEENLKSIKLDKSPNPNNEQVVGSVPANWTWSSF